MKPRRIVVAGGSGFIGRPLCRALWDNGKRDVFVLSRRVAERIEVPYASVVAWDGRQVGDWQAALDGADALVNLCGAGIADKRWTARRKQELADSRVLATRALVEALHGVPKPPRVFLSASAVGYYGDRGDETLDESSESGADFLAMLCCDWEKEALRAPKAVRTVLLRTGIVLGQGGGALRRLALPFRLGLGGPIGNGRQWMSWVSRDDVIGLILHALDSELAGPVNVTAPEPATNEQFSRALAQQLGRPSALRLPEGMARLAFGELSDVLLGGQRALPRHAQKDGYRFKHANLGAALEAALR